MSIGKNNCILDERDIEFTAIRSGGAGGQNVNKVSSAVQLRFDIRTSSLPEHCKHRLLRFHDSRITKDGIIVIKAQEQRSQAQNRDAAVQRLRELISNATKIRRKRKPTRPSGRSREKRLERKTRRGQLKNTRKKIRSWNHDH